MDETDRKTCRECWQPFTRVVGEGKKRFRTRLYCCFKCSSIGRSNKASAKTGRIVRPDAHYDDLSHGDKTSIAHESARIAYNDERQKAAADTAIREHVATFATEQAVGDCHAGEGRDEDPPSNGNSPSVGDAG